MENFCHKNAKKLNAKKRVSICPDDKYIFLLTLMENCLRFHKMAKRKEKPKKISSSKNGGCFCHFFQ